MTAFIGIEMGGTKIVLAHGCGPQDLSETIRIPTTTPQAAVDKIILAVNELIERHGPIHGLGIASFGPIGLSKKNVNYGRYLKTPKDGFAHFDLLTPLRLAFPNLAIEIETDVNGAAIGEGRWGAAQELNTFAYITVGTGVGVGLIVNGLPVHGLLHPEAGHILIRRDLKCDPYKGCCPFHADCLEGLVSGPAIEARTHQKGEGLSEDDPVWDLVGRYLAQLCYSLVLIASPQKIILGGGVGMRPRVLAQTRQALHERLGHYIEVLDERRSLDDFIALPGLGDRAGVLGAIALIKFANSPLHA